MSADRALFPDGLPTPFGPLCGNALRPMGQPLLLATINRALAGHRHDGELEFLTGRVLAVAISDLGLHWHFTHRRIDQRIVRATGPADATITGDSLSLAQIAARRTDPDTLFFRRRLAIEGDTELGLHAKNLLDTLELDALPAPLARLLDEAGRVAERLSG